MPHPNQVIAVRHPEAPEMFVVLDRAVDYEPDNVLVKAYPQFFVPIENANDIITSVSVESATAAPGEKRTRSKATKTPGK